MYDGWKLLLELNVSEPNAITIARRYSWGLDLAGLSGAQSGSIGVSPVNLEAAGTIGGLLAMSDPADDPNDVTRDYVYFHDASGNVTQLVDLAADPNAVVADPTTAIVTHYEYGPYGHRVNADPNSPDAYDQPFGFSGKYWDAETGLGNWGRRYYHPTLGRWISRDPIEEAGGVNVYAYVGNADANAIDPFGRDCLGMGGDLCVCQVSDPDCNGPDGTDVASQEQEIELNEMPVGDYDWRQHPLSCPKKMGLGGVAGETWCIFACANQSKDFYGVATCPPLGRERCFCVCTDDVAQFGPPASDIAEACIAEHEATHVEDDPDCEGNPSNECGAGINTLRCLATNIGRCRGEYFCLEYLKTLVIETQSGCTRDPSCSENERNACICGAKLLQAHINVLGGNDSGISELPPECLGRTTDASDAPATSMPSGGF